MLTTPLIVILASLVCAIKEKLVISNFAICKMPIKDAPNILVALCKDIFDVKYSSDEFQVIRTLDTKRHGVLVRVSSIRTKILILDHRQLFLLRGYHVDSA